MKISDSVQFPKDVVTQTLACIGRKGAGKTYLAQLIAEQMLDIRAQVVVIDPVGNWWGLRVGADGKSKGKDIFIAGGERGDVPVMPETGARFAKLVVEKNISIVLDVSGFRQGERKRFAADFAEEFFHLKKSQRSAVHLFVEESQLFAPQRVQKGEERMLGAFENIIRLGRNYGIGATMISQRPQSINKEVLSQVECLCVLQVNGSHERKALEEWVQEAGADRKLVGELPGLRQGEGYIWSPSWLRIFEKVQFVQKVTFDASATPEVGKAAEAARVSAVDVKALKADLEDLVAKASENDPTILKKTIAELKKQLASKIAPAHDVEIVRLKQLNGILQKTLKEREEVLAKVNKMVLGIIETAEAVQVATGNLKVIIGKQPVPIMPTLKPQKEWPKPQPESKYLTNGDHNQLKGPEQRILNAIAWLEGIGVESPEQPAVSFLAGYSYGGGAFNNPRGRLNVLGLVEYISGNRIRLTEAGRQAAEAPGIPLTIDGIHEAVLRRLPGPEQRLLKPLLDAYPDPLSSQRLAEAAGYAPGAGAFNNPRGRLKSLGLIEYPQPGMARARDLLFPA